MTYNKAIRFEWDENKNHLNQLKHQIDFRDAVDIFNDPHRIEFVDDRKDYKEMRHQTIGITQGVILFLVYTIRHKHYRIISVRRANRNECKTYYEYQTKR